MGYDIKLVKINVAEFYFKLSKNHECVDDIWVFKDILKHFGHIEGDYLYIIKQNFWENYNSFFELPIFIDKYYDIDDTFSVILEIRSEIEDMCSNSNEVMCRLGVE